MTSTDRPAPPTDLELDAMFGDILRGAGTTPEDITPAQFLAAVGNAETPDEVLDPRGEVVIERLTVPAASGDELLPALIARPKGASGALPFIYYTANGGKIRQGETAGLMPSDVRWVAAHGIALVSISPRPGPQHRHPAQVEDAVAGLTWLVDNAETLGLDPEAVILLGKSGGGGIAASTALHLRDHGGPRVAFQMLVYPMLDDRETTPSSTWDALGWTPAHNRMGWRAILGDEAAGENVSPYAAAARAEDLSGLPPAYIEVGSSEIFRDEDIDYATRLAAAGVPIELHSWMGGFHGFEIIAPDAEISRACLAARDSFLARAVSSLRPRG